MAIATLRILTAKSKLNFGSKGNLTVQFLLDNRDFYTLISAYYCTTTITYKPEILEKLKITEDWQINKPGKDPLKMEGFLQGNKYNLNLSDREGNKKIISTKDLKDMEDSRATSYLHSYLSTKYNADRKYR